MFTIDADGKVHCTGEQFLVVRRISKVLGMTVPELLQILQTIWWNRVKATGKVP